MQLIITSTNLITTINGQRVRVWRGVTAGGVDCDVFVARLAANGEDDVTEFEAELKETLQPSETCPAMALWQTLRPSGVAEREGPF